VQLQGANLQRAQLQGASLKGIGRSSVKEAKLQGADMKGANVWLVSFPSYLANYLKGQVPIGVEFLRTSPLTTEDKIELRAKLQAYITDDEVLKEVLERLYPILQNDSEKWDEEGNWSQYIEQTKKQSLDDTVKFLVSIVCEDPEGHIAIAMAERATDDTRGRYDYARGLAEALLKAPCEGAQALSEEKRAMLKAKLGFAPE
jgi:hypothetical protein